MFKMCCLNVYRFVHLLLFFANFLVLYHSKYLTSDTERSILQKYNRLGSSQISVMAQNLLAVSSAQLQKMEIHISPAEHTLKVKLNTVFSFIFIFLSPECLYLIQNKQFIPKNLQIIFSPFSDFLDYYGSPCISCLVFVHVP